MGTLPKSGTQVVEVAATPEQVWAVLADVTRADEWGHESQSGEWIDGATEAVPGARFRGHNQKGRMKWGRTCEVLVAEEPAVISWRTIATRIYNDSTRWTYELEAVDGGCRITQHFEVLKLGPVTDRLFYALIPAHRDRSAALAEDVRRLGEVAGRAVTASPS